MANKNLYVHNGLTIGSSVEINGTSGNISTTGIVTSTNVTNATSTNTGALQVVGGVGIGGNLVVGGTITGTLSGVATTASNVSVVARTTNASHYLTFVDSNNASATGENVYTTSSFVINPSTGNVGIGTTSPGNQLDVVNTTSYKGITVRGNAAPSIVFDSSNSAIDWKIGNSGNDASKFAISTGSLISGELMVIDSSGNVGIGSLTPQAKLDVAGGINATGITTVTNTTVSTSTTTGALQVAGGVGIGGDLNVGGTVHLTSGTSSAFYMQYNPAAGAVDFIFG